MSDIDWRLVTKAALNGLTFVAPAAIVGALIDEVSTPVAIAIAGVQILGFCFAGWVVRRLVPASPMISCALAGLGCAVIVQAVGIVTSLVSGGSLNPLSWLATALVATLAGTAGGILARVERVTSSEGQEE